MEGAGTGAEQQQVENGQQPQPGRPNKRNNTKQNPKGNGKPKDGGNPQDQQEKRGNQNPRRGRDEGGQPQENKERTSNQKAGQEGGQPQNHQNRVNNQNARVGQEGRQPQDRTGDQNQRRGRDDGGVPQDNRNPHQNNQRGGRNNYGGQYQHQEHQHQERGGNNYPGRGRGGAHFRNPRNDNYKGAKSAKDFDKMINERKDHGGVMMTGNRSDCLICCQPSDVFGVGDCNHAVCMECCVRMRILGESKSCPQCRRPLDTLYFISAPKEWTDQVVVPKADIKHKDAIRHGIKFTDQYTVDAYDGYMAHTCQVCLSNGDRLEFPTFGALRHHASNTHNRLYCTICYENCNILSKDRHSYTPDELRLHTEGRANETMGQKGHPKCMFCDQRFFDDDHLYRHLRRDHFFCQICDAEGHNLFYRKIDELYKHYKLKHHPCMDQECVTLGIVFASDVELGIHRASEHGSSARNVNIDFQFSGRNLGNRILRTGEGRGRRSPEFVPSQPPPAPPPPVNSTIVLSAQSTRPRIVPSSSTVVPSAQVRPPAPKPNIRQTYQSTGQDFPSLGQPANNGVIPIANWRQEVRTMRNVDVRPAPAPVQVNSREQFPSLTKSNPIRSTAEDFPSLGPTRGAVVPKKPQNIWAKGKSTQLFTDHSKAPRQPPIDEARRKVLPTPDVWPEGMRERVEAKMKTGVDPGPPEQVPLDPLFRVEAARRAKRDQKKQKAKSVAAGTVVTEKDSSISTSQSKFNALQEIDESRKQTPSPPLISMRKTADNFVRIESVPTLRGVASSIGAKKDPVPTPSTGPSTRPNQPVVEPPSEPVSSIPPANYDKSLPSLTDIVSGFWPFGKTGQSKQEEEPPSQNNDNKSWTTAAPPGFS